MLDNKDIKDIFNNSSLEDQDWLEPSDSIFSGIEEAIYNEEEEKKPILLWLLGAGLLLCCIGLTTWAYNDSLPALESLKIEKENINQKAVISEEMNSSSNYQSDNNINEINSNANDLSVNTAEEGINSEDKSESNTALNIINKTKAQTILSKSNTNLDSYKAGLNTNPIKFQNVIVKKNTSTTPNNKTINSPKLKLPISLTNTPKNIKYQKSLISNDLIMDPIVESEVESISSFKVGLGTSIWNFHLNDNYTSALNPADFSHSNGTGVNMNIAYEKTIAPSIAFVGTVTLEKIKYQSGHNSTVTYDQGTEVGNQENEFDLTMASPMGFLESQVVVQRSTNSTDPPGDLILDLHNEHENYNVDFNIALLRRLISTKSFNTSLQLGVGVNYLFDIKNNLSEVNINNTNYSTTLTSITGNQNNINPTRPYYSFGLNVEKKISNKLGIGMNALYMKDFTSVYSDQDFSTIISRYMVHASLKYSF